MRKSLTPDLDIKRVLNLDLALMKMIPIHQRGTARSPFESRIKTAQGLISTLFCNILGG